MSREHEYNIPHGALAPVDILAIGPHPDDIEIGAGGSLIRWVETGYRVGLVDLTLGELGTKGNADTRRAESAVAAQRIGALFRINLELPDGSLEDSPAARNRLVPILRQCRPEWVLCNLEDSRHPDHAAAARLARSAFFLSRLPKYLPEHPAHSPGLLAFYLIHESARPSFLVDISATLAAKRELLRAYTSQFVDPVVPEGYRYAGLSDYLENVRAFGETWGALSGRARAAEAFVTDSPLLLRDISQWVSRSPAP